MATSSEILCGICHAQHITNTAEYWCPECDEGLCGDCEKHHRLSKASRNHGVITIENYRRLPPEISNIAHYCEDHERKFQNYCPTHEKLCCPVCISTEHNKCMGLLVIDDVLKTSKRSTLMDTMQVSLEDIKNNIHKAVKDRKQNLAKIQEQRQTFNDDIKQVRERTNSHLDQLERKIIKDLNVAEAKLKSEIESLLNKLNEKSNTIDELQNNIIAIKNHATDLQTFLGSRHIEKQVEQEESYMQSLYDDGSLKQMSLKFSINHTISDMPSTVTSFGSISTEQSPPIVVLKKEKEKQAQIISIIQQPVLKGISDVRLTLLRKFEIPGGKAERIITGCTTTPDGKMIFADCDNNQRLVITNDHGNLDKEICLSPCMPFDVTCTDERLVAITTWFSKQIKIVDIESKKVCKTTNTNYDCFGIAYSSGSVIYCENNKRIQLLQLNNNNISTLIKLDNINVFSYVAVNGDNIYNTKRFDCTVTCYNKNKERIWTFTDKSILDGPNGVTVDKDSNVYVASSYNDSIVIISPDGKQGRQLLKAEDGISGPAGLHFDKDRNTLLVANYSGTAFLYRVS